MPRHAKDKNHIIINKLRDYNKSATDSTLEAYSASLTKLYNDLNVSDYSDIEPLKDVQKIISKLKEKEYLNNTMKNKLSAIISYLLANKVDKKIINEYTDAIDSLAGKIAKEQSKMEWSKKDDDNRMGIDELHSYVDNMFVDLPDGLRHFKDIFKYQLYLSAAFHLEAALRNELSDAQLYTSAEFQKIKDRDDVNYIIVDPKTFKIKVILNVFKTKNSTPGGQIVFNIDDNKVLGETFIKYLKGIKEYYKYDNIPFEHWMLFNANHKKITRNDFTRLMIEAFKGTGNNITSSLIRKIVASDLIDVNKLKKQAYIEGHSIKTMLNSYVKG
jgi:hypothetical protein